MTFRLESQVGTYALVLRSRSSATTQVGRWGRLDLRAGYYIYVGSAFGPGGVRARVSRHLRMEKRKHWHIDYVRELTTPVGVWYSHQRRHLEHEWARFLSDASDLSSIEKFGCSDCDCPTHLFYATRAPALNAVSGIDNGEISWLPYRSGRTFESSISWSQKLR